MRLYRARCCESSASSRLRPAVNRQCLNWRPQQCISCACRSTTPANLKKYLIMTAYTRRVRWQPPHESTAVTRYIYVPKEPSIYPEVVHDNVVSNGVTITSSLRSDVMILGITFQFFLVKWVLSMIHAKNYEIASTFVKLMQKKTVASCFETRCRRIARSSLR